MLPCSFKLTENFKLNRIEKNAGLLLNAEVLQVSFCADWPDWPEIVQPHLGSFWLISILNETEQVLIDRGSDASLPSSRALPSEKMVSACETIS